MKKFEDGVRVLFCANPFLLLFTKNQAFVVKN